MNITYRDHTRSAPLIAYAAMSAVMVVLLSSALHDFRGEIRWASVAGVGTFSALCLYQLWVGLNPVGVEISIELHGEEMRIMRKGLEVYAGVRLIPSQILEDGVAFHIYPSGRKWKFTVPKHLLSEKQSEILRQR